MVARDAAGNRSTASPALAVTTAPSGTTTGGACRVSWTSNDWDTGFTGTVRVTNTGPQGVNPWSLQWSFTAGQTATQSWSARVTQSGAAVTATGESSNATLAPGASVSFGFNGSHAGSNPPGRVHAERRHLRDRVIE